MWWQTLRNEKMWLQTLRNEKMWLQTLRNEKMWLQTLRNEQRRSPSRLLIPHLVLVPSIMDPYYFQNFSLFWTSLILSHRPHYQDPRSWKFKNKVEKVAGKAEKEKLR